MQWAAAVVAIFALLGTGGIAVAGALPAPVQGMMADVARALPLPFEIPYPHSHTDDGPASRRAPEDGEVEFQVFVPTTTPLEPAPEPSPADDVQLPPRDESDEDRGDRGDACDLDDLSSERGRLDEDEWRELRGRLQEECGLDFVAPPSFTEGDRDHRDDRDRGGDDRSRNDRDEERREGDSDDDEGRGSEQSDRRDGDGQEERDHDGDRDYDRGPGGRWGDGRD